ALNPLICEGQLHGGLAQGIGQALLEEVVYDPAGQLVSGSLGDYALPRADDLPPFTAALDEVPCRTNPLGVKGIGEVGAVGAPPAVVAAVLDALRPLGVDHLDMPLRASAVWARLRRAPGDAPGDAPGRPPAGLRGRVPAAACGAAAGLIP